VVQRVARGAAGDAQHRRTLANALFISALLGGLCTVVGLTPVGALLARATIGDPAFAPELLAALVLAALGGPIAIGLGYLQGLQRIEAASALYVCRSFGSALVMIGVALAGFGLRWVMFSAIAADTVFLAVLVAAIRPGLRWRDVSVQEIRWMAAFALPFAAANGLYLALNALPRYFLVHAAGLAAVAGFSAAISLTAPLLQVAGAVQYVVYPAAVRRTGGGIGTAANLVARSAAALLCFASFALVGLCFLGPPALAVLSGGRLAGTPAQFAIISYGMLCLGLYRVIVIRQLMNDSSKALLAPLATSAAVVGLASALLVPRAGAVGAAQALLLGCVSLLGHAGWQQRASWLAASMAPLRPLGVRAGLALLVPVTGVLIWPGPSLTQSLACAAAGLGAVAAAWFTFGGMRQLRSFVAA
jgi:O-antigen/teichoic acid export membrane protein